MNNELALLLGYSILHYSHVKKVFKYIKNNDEIPHSISAYMSVLFEDSADPNSIINAGNKENFRKRMEEFYKDICLGYKAKLILSEEDTIKVQERYKKLFSRIKTKSQRPVKLKLKRL